MKKIVAFVCTHNSCRSQMAEGYLKAFGSDIADVYSAGTVKYPQVKPKAIEAMKCDGIDIAFQYPKLLKEIPLVINILVTMGCGVVCPQIPCEYRIDWGIDDPSGGSIEDFIKTRDLIKKKVVDLIEKIKNDDLEGIKETTNINFTF
ncbi:MAG: arsenate reductase ArsC [Clostridiales bacterium]|nr:arsenate reductase ArsC [Clostridiales bacterium]